MTVSPARSRHEGPRRFGGSTNVPGLGPNPAAGSGGSERVGSIYISPIVGEMPDALLSDDQEHTDRLNEGLNELADSLRNSSPFQFLSGLITGGMAGAAPGGFALGPVADATGLDERYPRSFRMGFGLGEAAWGLAELVAGGVLTGGGGAVSAGSSGLGSPVGVPAMVFGTAVAGEGLADIGFGVLTFAKAFSEDSASSSTSAAKGGGYRVSSSRRTHILEGDAGVPGSGHGPNQGSTRGAFPDTWTDEQAIAAIERVANSRSSTWKQTTGPGFDTATITRGGPAVGAPVVNSRGRPVRFEVRGQDHSLDITVIIEPGPGGQGIVTGYVRP